MSDRHNLQRFVDAQNPVFEQACLELRQGRKTSHWIWFIFPQLIGLGTSETARFYGLASLEEAEEYSRHPILGPRLTQCTQLVIQLDGRTLEELLGHPDDLKFRSSMTLFAEATPDNRIFVEALQKYCDGQPDRLTLERLRRGKGK